jgi:hypothetical protein
VEALEALPVGRRRDHPRTDLGNFRDWPSCAGLFFAGYRARGNALPSGRPKPRFSRACPPETAIPGAARSRHRTVTGRVRQPPTHPCHDLREAMREPTDDQLADALEGYKLDHRQIDEAKFGQLLA